MNNQALPSKPETTVGPPPDPSPDSSQDDLPTTKTKPPAAATRHGLPHFPATMNAYGQWGKIRSFNLCGAAEKDRLCHVEVHTGYSGKPPLGTRPGVVLYDGRDGKAPVLAAAGYESYRAASSYGFDGRSVVMMPALAVAGGGGGGGGGVEDGGLVVEQMPAMVCGGRVVFVFEVEVGAGKMVRRERFGWWKVGKGTDDTAKDGGFKLVALPASHEGGLSGQGSTASDMPGDADSGEVLAFLTWRRLFPKFKHAFTLELLGQGQSGELGERWSLMVVITALRIWALRLNGKTRTGVIAAA
ncbi:uncharacterized protein B0H64DRAFT_474332 [Chaetomium fimeti]|uniref:Uncharacterized protein n=1 Tax=Chaetomium fimeti TaxID=1854472 RepID=A0AAE0LSM5_9PEZI|nr:hypothetical protein B0H64DRAFT_474332 [Chaetomium fimeti]